MSQKSVTDLIFDKFAESVKHDPLFKGISSELIDMIREKKLRKTELQNLMRKKLDEASKP